MMPSERDPSPPDPPNCLETPLRFTYISAHLDVPVYLSVGGPAGTKANSLSPMLAYSIYTCLSDFRNQLKVTACFAVFVLSMKEVAKG